MKSSAENRSIVNLSIAGGIARLWFSHPPVNAMSEQLAAEFHSALDELEELDGCSVLHIGTGLKVFSAGGDLVSMSKWLSEPDGGRKIGQYAAGVQRLMARIEALPQVTMAEIGGPALGGGLELALATDVCIASRTAKFGLPEVGIGLLPGAGGTQRLTARCGRAMATRLILGAEVINAELAQQLGIVQWVVDAEDLSQQAANIAKRFSSMPKHALRVTKACIAAAVHPHLNGYAAEIEGITLLGNSSESRERISAFLNGNATRGTPR
jgi:enoyl-CoA hydratase